MASPGPLKQSQPKFQLLGVNVGEDQEQHLTATGKGRFFGLSRDHYAFQAQGEYHVLQRPDKEGQFDLGLVDRIGRFQAGLFASFKHVALAGNQNGGTLGQAALTLDYHLQVGQARMCSAPTGS